MEHLNLGLKKLLQAMGVKITEAAAQRCLRSITIMNEVMVQCMKNVANFIAVVTMVTRALKKQCNPL